MRAPCCLALADATLVATGPDLAGAAEPHLDGASLGLLWVLPFAGMLLSIALVPLFAPRFWHDHFGKVSLAWALGMILPLTALHGPELAAYELLHTALLDYLPFIILLFTLYTVTG